MGVDVTLNTVASGFNRSVINANFALIETALEDALSRSGGAPNTLSADIDLNSNDLLNVATVNTAILKVAGVRVTDATYVPDWKGSWTTSTTYVINDTVREVGTVYICLVAHTSTTFSTDLTANKWEIFAEKGATGGGTGDMLATNNLSDVANVATSRSNLGLGDVAVQNKSAIDITGGTVVGITDLAIADGGTAASTASDAFNNLKQSASTSATGVSELSTEAEGNTGTSASLVTPVSVVKSMIITHGLGGGLVFISSTDLSSDATADFTGFDATKYDGYVFELANVIPATDAVDLLMRTSTNGGSSYDSGGTDYAYQSGNSALESSTGASAMQINGTTTIGSAGGEDGLSGTIKLNGPHLTKDTHIHHYSFHQGPSSGAPTSQQGGGFRKSAADVDAVRFLMSSGNLESGTITMYGVVNA